MFNVLVRLKLLYQHAIDVTELKLKQLFIYVQNMTKTHKPLTKTHKPIVKTNGKDSSGHICPSSQF